MMTTLLSAILSGAVALAQTTPPTPPTVPQSPPAVVTQPAPAAPIGPAAEQAVPRIVTTPGNEGAAIPGAAAVTPGSTAAPGTTGAPAPATAAPRPQGLFDSPFIIIMLGVLGLMLVTTVMGGRKEKKKRAALMNSLETGDRVMTLGGIIGTVTEIKDDEVLVRVDEGSNTRIRFARSAVQQILRKSSAPASTTEAKPAKEAVNA